MSSRFYRNAVISLVISGIGISASTPQVSLFFVTELDASLPVAGLFYLTNIAAPIAGFAVGRLSDQRQDRLTLFRICAVVGAAGGDGVVDPGVDAVRDQRARSQRRRRRGGADLRRGARRAVPRAVGHGQPGDLDHPDGLHRRLDRRAGARQLVRRCRRPPTAAARLRSLRAAADRPAAAATGPAPRAPPRPVRIRRPAASRPGDGTDADLHRPVRAGLERRHAQDRFPADLHGHRARHPPMRSVVR